jgi:ribonuclease HI
MHRIYVDGGARGNPGPAAIGFVVYDAEGRELHREGEYIGIATNNIAEYRALLSALRWVRRSIGFKDEVHIHSDSDLVVRQMSDHYRVKSENLKPLHREAREIFDRLKRGRIGHVGRSHNRIADGIVNEVLDERKSSPAPDPSPS